MNQFKSRRTQRIETLVESIQNQAVSQPLDELLIWTEIAVASTDSDIRELVSVALQNQKLSHTISDWSADEFRRHTTADPMHRSVWWIHPVTRDQMVVIPAGRCLLGPEPKPVTVPGFSMSRFPVTNRQFHGFLEQTTYQPRDDQSRGSFLHHWIDGLPPAQLLDHPVTWINVADAQAYCVWASAQLPSTVQWEKSARGCDGRRFPWGNARHKHLPSHRASESQELSSLQRSTFPVGELDVRSPYGCEDLSGNVSQWCIAAKQPSYPGERKFQFPVRGACFFRVSNTAIESSHERWLHVQRRNQWVGFRICC